MSDLAPIGLLVVDRDLRVCWMNQAILAINGLSPGDVGTKSIAELLPGVEPEAWLVIRRVLATGEPILDVDLAGTTPATGPDQRAWRVSHYPIRDRDGITKAVGVAVVDVTEQRHAEAGREAVERRLRLLSRASGLVGASLDLSAILEGLIELVVPEFADESILLLTDEPLDTAARPNRLPLRRLVNARVAGFPEPPPGLQIGERIEFASQTPHYQVLAVGEPQLHQMGEQLVRNLDIPGAGEYFRQIGLRSVIHVPLLAGGNFHGVVIFGVGSSGRSYTEHDVQLAAELGSRISSAIANARAYAHQHTAALTLQRGLLPGNLPAVEGLELAWRYEPGTAATEVGGDWFDVIGLSAGRVALVIGDVMGRGLTAAAVMGQVRAAVRAFAALDLPAADVLTHLDDLVRSIDAGPDGALVSCIYAIFEPATATITVANAGHLPPALVDPHADVHLLDDDSGIILGVASQRLTETRYPFPPGATLSLYTDGLVESPTTDIAQGTRRLQAALADPAGLHTTADRLFTLIDRTGGYDDDAALLLVHATTPATVSTRRLPPDPRAAKTARDAAVAALYQWHLAEHIDLVELLVSELVTNAIRYAQTPSHLTLRRGQHALYVEIADSDSRVPRLLNPTPDDEGGRGLQLVAELATHWGARPTRTGKTVWFQLDTPDTPDTPDTDQANSLKAGSEALPRCP